MCSSLPDTAGLRMHVIWPLCQWTSLCRDKSWAQLSLGALGPYYPVQGSLYLGRGLTVNWWKGGEKSKGLFLKVHFYPFYAFLYFYTATKLSQVENRKYDSVSFPTRNTEKGEKHLIIPTNNIFNVSFKLMLLF